MSDQNYPLRGAVSADGRTYTHTDGTVHEIVDHTPDGWRMCPDCSFDGRCDYGVIAPCNDTTVFKRIPGAYVPSSEELAACDMARAMIVFCGGPEEIIECYECDKLEDKSCPARIFLASNGAADAWSVQ